MSPDVPIGSFARGGARVDEELRQVRKHSALAKTFVLIATMTFSSFALQPWHPRAVFLSDIISIYASLNFLPAGPQRHEDHSLHPSICDIGQSFGAVPILLGRHSAILRGIMPSYAHCDAAR